MVATQEASKLDKKPQKTQDKDTTDEETDEEPNFINSMGAAGGGNQRPTPDIEFSQRPSTVMTNIVSTQSPQKPPRSLMFRSDEDEENLAPTTPFNNFPERKEFPAAPSLFSNNDDDRSQPFDYGSDFSE